VDHLPQLDGMDQFYGTSVFHCPYCDGWEMRDQPLAAYGQGKSGAGLALSLKTWSRDVVLCTNGRTRLRAQDRERLERHWHSRSAGSDRASGRTRRRARAHCLPRRRGAFAARNFLQYRQNEACDLASNSRLYVRSAGHSAYQPSAGD
jgi:hypothetical protein